jgi:glycosyltransferase involved in cell wall biosynthesis
LKFSIIIATLNNEQTIEKTILSLKVQKFKDFEIIFVDGGSKDRTLKIIADHHLKNIRVINQVHRGVYNAFNLGVDASKGEIIVFLNADDFFSNENVLNLINQTFLDNSKYQVVISNVKIINKEKKVIRNYKCNFFKNFMFYFGLMPPHPGIFIKREIYSKYGKFVEKFNTAGDFEFILRIFVKHKVIYKKIDYYLVSMLSGGKSNKNIKSFILNTIEIKKALKINKLFSSYILISFRFVIKLFQFIN